MKHHHKTVVTVVASLLLFGSYSKSDHAPPSKPSILFIFTDDQQWNTINALGNKAIHTPGLDRLTEGAFIFTNAYCFGGNSGAVCIPSRNMLMSGKTFFRFQEDCKRLERLGGKPRRIHYTNPDWPTIPKTMREEGYETYFREKSGSANNPVVRTQFDHFADIHQVKALKTGRPAQGIVDDAIRFLKEERNTKRPFFMYLGIPAPHDPRWSLQRFRDIYDIDRMPLPENYAPVHAWDIGSMTIRDERLEIWPRTKAAIRRHILDYYAIITAMDFDIARLLDVVDEEGLNETSIIIFSSDQGLALGQHGLMGKQNIYEGTMKVPLIIKGPGIEDGRSDALVYLHDIFPTLCDFGKTPIPDGLDGMSLSGIIEGRESKIRQHLLLAYMHFQRSIRNERWKLMRFPQIGKTLLFDLKNDPFEKNNLAEDSQYGQRIVDLTEKLDRERRSLGDTIDLFPNDYSPAEFLAPKHKLPTMYPAGGLAPGDPAFME